MPWRQAALWVAFICRISVDFAAGQRNLISKMAGKSGATEIGPTPRRQEAANHHLLNQ